MYKIPLNTSKENHLNLLTLQLRQSNKTIYSLKELQTFFATKKEETFILKSNKFNDFLDFLIENKTIKEKIILKFTQRKYTRYTTTDNYHLYELALSINQNAYLSHYTAVFLNSLTNNIPKTVYVNYERTAPGAKPNTPLTQKNINKAFYREPRISDNVARHNNYNIYLLQGKHTAQLGVKTHKLSNNNHVRVTGVERTLIDIAVSPYYCGGVYEVLNIYKNAKNIVSPVILANFLKRLDYIYPYHQVIGFYMDKAGYNEETLQLFESFGIKYKFFLLRELIEPDRYLDQRWNLLVPKFL